MEINEAIQRIENLISWEGHDIFITKNFVKELEDIIATLKLNELKRQQGEAYKAENVELKAYKAMWEELHILHREYFSNYETRTENIIRMKRLFEKYFPKEANPNEADNTR